MNSSQRRKVKRSFKVRWPYKYEMSFSRSRAKWCDMESWLIQNDVKYLREWDYGQFTNRIWFANEKDYIWFYLKW